jgi:hypothetical protein
MLEENLAVHLAEDARAWLQWARGELAEFPWGIGILFPVVARHCGKGLLDEGWTTQDAARSCCSENCRRKYSSRRSARSTDW